MLPIDKEQVLKTGTIKPEDADKIVDTIKWNVKQNNLYRNDLMLLDLIATNNWARPIYFANPSSIKSVLDVDKYCHMEGIVYRFTPVPATEYISNVGGVDADRSYEVLMNDKVRWGRLNEDDVTVDRESARTVGIMKQDYFRLAQSLVARKKYDSAVDAMDRSLYFFPEKKFPFDYYMIYWPDTYYKAGATEKGNKMVEDIARTYEENLDYYYSLDDKMQNYYKDDIQQAMAVLQRLNQVTDQYKQKALSDTLNKTLYDNFSRFNMR